MKLVARSLGIFRENDNTFFAILEKKFGRVSLISLYNSSKKNYIQVAKELINDLKKVRIALALKNDSCYNFSFAINSTKLKLVTARVRMMVSELCPFDIDTLNIKYSQISNGKYLACVTLKKTADASAYEFKKYQLTLNHLIPEYLALFNAATFVKKAKPIYMDSDRFTTSKDLIATTIGENNVLTNPLRNIDIAGDIGMLLDKYEYQFLVAYGCALQSVYDRY